jgi:hypothetical protein
VTLEDQSDKTVFISYAREDSAEAERLYGELRNAGAKPWIDKEEIRPGESWKYSITKAIKHNRYFIPMISSKSVIKVGYVNNELSYALELSKSYPEGAIYIIPVRVDECDIPENLINLHHADLFPDWNNGVTQILRSMEIEANPEKVIEAYDEEWKMGLSDNDWEHLLVSICKKKCIPFIGAGVYKIQNKDEKELIPLSKDIINKLKEKHRYLLEDLYEMARIYALEDSYQLARLAQFLAIEHAEGNEMDPKNLLSEMIKEIDSANFSSESKMPYDVLADLDLPLYFTTNYDHFLEEALIRNIRKQPESDFFKWSNEVITYVKTVGFSSVFDDPQYKPTEQRPLVYHIHGDINTPESMVLTEKDYFEFVINTNMCRFKKEELEMYPSLLRKELATSSLLFVGYTLEDINFRTIFQGFLTFLDSLGKNRKPSIAVQLPPHISKKGQGKMQKYLEQYTRNMFPNVHVFWGDSAEFIRELDKRWREFKQKNDMKTCDSIGVT